MKKTYQYICGQYPIPMIMMYEEANQNAFDEDFAFSYGKWSPNDQHIWTIDAYIIYRENQIIAYKYNYFANFVWLLKKINRPFLIEIDDEDSQEQIQQYLLDVFIEI